jgi:hypothetical protein
MCKRVNLNEVGAQICEGDAYISDSYMNTDGVAGFRHQAQCCPWAADAARLAGLLSAFLDDDALFNQFGDQIRDRGRRKPRQLREVDARDVVRVQQRE